MNKESKLYKYPIGAYFFKYENEDLVLLRLWKVKDKNRYIMKDMKENVSVRLTKDQFESYTMLKPDGLIVHVLASDPMQGIDTLCMLYKLEDIDNNIPEPYAVCRQNIIDPFETLLNNDPNKTYVGVSISKDTAMEGFDFRSVCSAAGIREQRMHFVYKDDSLDDILKFANQVMFDKALGIIKNHMDESDNMKYVGFKNTYRELLEENDFMYDFRRAFGIIRINLAIDTSIERWTDDGIYKFNYKEVEVIESITKHQVIDPVLIKYDKSIDLDEIKRSYIIFEDTNKNIYVLSYDKGNYINREYDALSDKRDRDLLIKKMYK